MAAPSSSCLPSQCRCGTQCLHRVNPHNHSLFTCREWFPCAAVAAAVTREIVHWVLRPLERSAFQTRCQPFSGKVKHYVLKLWRTMRGNWQLCRHETGGELLLFGWVLRFSKKSELKKYIFLPCSLWSNKSDKYIHVGSAFQSSASAKF